MRGRRTTTAEYRGKVDPLEIFLSPTLVMFGFHLDFTQISLATCKLHLRCSRLDTSRILDLSSLAPGQTRTPDIAGLPSPDSQLEVARPVIDNPFHHGLQVRTLNELATTSLRTRPIRFTAHHPQTGPSSPNALLFGISGLYDTH